MTGLPATRELVETLQPLRWQEPKAAYDVVGEKLLGTANR